MKSRKQLLSSGQQAPRVSGSGLTRAPKLPVAELPVSQPQLGAWDHLSLPHQREVKAEAQNGVEGVEGAKDKLNFAVEYCPDDPISFH